MAVVKISALNFEVSDCANKDVWFFPIQLRNLLRVSTCLQNIKTQDKLS